MSIRTMAFIISCFLVLPFFILSACYATRPLKPGHDFVWIEPHRNPSGDIVPGHWKHLKHPRSNAVWVPGHHGPKGHWR